MFGMLSFWAQYIVPLQKQIFSSTSIASLSLLLLFLAACEPEATPIALVEDATSVVAANTVVPTNPPNLRYGIFVNADGFVSDLAEIQSRASVEVFYDIGRFADYDIAVAYGVVDGWELSPVRQHLVLSINPNLSPLDNESIRALIPQMIDSRALIEALGLNGMLPSANSSLPGVEIRTSLANMAYPDGLRLSLATSRVPGLEQIIAEFNASNIQIQLLEAGNQAHLRLTLLPEVPEGAIELYSLPISYIAKDGIAVEFSENSWPLPSP